MGRLRRRRQPLADRVSGRWCKGLQARHDGGLRVREQPRDIKLAGSAEFVESPAALPSFERTYQFWMSGEQLVSSSASEKRSCPESSATFNHQPLPSSKRSGFSSLISSSAFRISGRTSPVSPTSIPPCREFQQNRSRNGNPIASANLPPDDQVIRAP